MSTSLSAKSIPISDIIIPDDASRFRAGDSNIDELATSIDAHGLIYPIIVCPTKDNKKYLLIAGHRRTLAFISLGKTSIPAIIRNVDPAEIETIRLTENIQREGLSPLEEAVAIKRFRDNGDLTQEAAAEVLGKGVSWIKKREALLRLQENVMDSLHAGNINPSVAMELGRIQDDATRDYYIDFAIRYGATQDVAATWVNNYDRDGATADPQKLEVSTENYQTSRASHRVPCGVCDHAMSIHELNTILICTDCQSLIETALRTQ